MLNISKDKKRYSEIELDLHKKLAYEKGRASIIEEFEKIKEEMDKDRAILFYDTQKVEVLDEWIKILDKRISELKGEQK